MKYIKKYEFFNDEISDFDKYCVFKSKDYPEYHIYEITKVEKDVIIKNFKIYYLKYVISYLNNKYFEDVIYSKKSNTYYWEDDMKTNIIAHDNNLEKLKERLPILISSQNYNI